MSLVSVYANVSALASFRVRVSGWLDLKSLGKACRSIALPAHPAQKTLGFREHLKVPKGVLAGELPLWLPSGTAGGARPGPCGGFRGGPFADSLVHVASPDAQLDFDPGEPTSRSGGVW